MLIKKEEGVGVALRSFWSCQPVRTSGVVSEEGQLLAKPAARDHQWRDHIFSWLGHMARMSDDYLAMPKQILMFFGEYSSTKPLLGH